MLRDVRTPGDLIRRLVIAELLARRGEGPLSLRAAWGMRRGLAANEPAQGDRASGERREGPES